MHFLWNDIIWHGQSITFWIFVEFLWNPLRAPGYSVMASKPGYIVQFRWQVVSQLVPFNGQIALHRKWKKELHKTRLIAFITKNPPFKVPGLAYLYILFILQLNRNAHNTDQLEDNMTLANMPTSVKMVPAIRVLLIWQGVRRLIQWIWFRGSVWNIRRPQWFFHETSALYTPFLVIWIWTLLGSWMPIDAFSKASPLSSDVLCHIIHSYDFREDHTGTSAPSLTVSICVSPINARCLRVYMRRQ